MSHTLELVVKMRTGYGDPDFDGLDLPPDPAINTRDFLKSYGFTVHEVIDTNTNDGNYISFNKVKNEANRFKDSLDSNDVVVCWMYMHGFNMPWPILYWCGLFGDWYKAGGVISDKVMEPMGNPLDFLWLYSCYGWDWREDFWGNNFNELTKPENAGNLIFWGHEGIAYVGSHAEEFDERLQWRKSEGMPGYIDNDILWWMNSHNYESNFKEKRTDSISMDLFDINLKCSDNSGSKGDDFNSKLLFQDETTNFSLDNINYSLFDRDDDGNNDSMTVSWDANTVFSEAIVTMIGYVTNANHTMIQGYEYGPYTIYGNDSEDAFFNFSANKTDLYDVELFLINESTSFIVGSFLQNISLNKSTGITSEKERFTSAWFDTIDSNTDGIDDTVNISWNADTTAAQENISVFIPIGEEFIKYGPYTIYNSSQNTGYVEIYLNQTGTYRTNLMLVDSESHCEDFYYLEIPLGVSRFTDYYVDYGVNVDVDDLYEYLALDVGVNITDPGNYSVSGVLYDKDGDIAIGGTGRNITYLESGNQTVQLVFDGETLYKSGYDGEYSLRFLTLDNETYEEALGVRSNAYTTLPYNHTDFQHPAVMFDSFSDYAIDTNSNGLYEYLIINVTVNNTVADNYVISGCLYDENNSFVAAAVNYTYLDIGLQTVQLSFNGTMISYHGANGPYDLTITVGDNREENAYMTNPYTAVDFETSLVAMYHYVDFEAPTELLLAQTDSIVARITNPSGRVLKDFQASLNLSSELNTTDPLVVDLGDFEPFETKEVSWLVEAENTGYVSLMFNLTSVDIENVTITGESVVHHFPISVNTDKGYYGQGEDVVITTTLTDGNPEVAYLDLTLNITIESENISGNYSQSIQYIEALETMNITYIWNATGETGDIITVTVRIFEGSMLLNETSSSIIIDIAPYIPVKPSGRTIGTNNRLYTYTSSTTDVNGDQIWYNFSWDDGSFSGWLGPFDSGVLVNASHSWTHDGLYNVRVKAKDIYDVESVWSECLSVRIFGVKVQKMDDPVVHPPIPSG